MVVVSGNGQTGVMGTLLADPIVVQVTHRDSTPFANKVVTFAVTRSNGRLTADGIGEGNLTLQVHTDANGQAQAFWRLGSDAGCGNNRVEVKSVDIIGTTFFCASATHAPPRQINIGTGNSQRVELMRYIQVLEEKLGRKAQLNLLPMQPGDVARTEADVEETRRALDYAPSTPIEVGIGAFVDWYLDYYAVKA